MSNTSGPASVNGVEPKVGAHAESTQCRDSERDQYTDEIEGKYIEELESRIDELEAKVGEMKSSQELLKTIKEVLLSPNAPKIVEALWTPLSKAKEADANAHVEASKIYAKSSFTNNIFFIVALGCCLTFLGIVISMLRTDKDLLLPVLSALISLIAGAGGGYVFGKQAAPK